MKLISFNSKWRLLITSPAELNNRSDDTLVHYTDTRAICANTGKDISTCSFNTSKGLYPLTWVSFSNMLIFLLVHLLKCLASEHHFSQQCNPRTHVLELYQIADASEVVTCSQLPVHISFKLPPVFHVQTLSVKNTSLKRTSRSV